MPLPRAIGSGVGEFAKMNDKIRERSPTTSAQQAQRGTSRPKAPAGINGVAGCPEQKALEHGRDGGAVAPVRRLSQVVEQRREA